ncbi:MAG: hypothetical protein IJA52_03680 [Clostridia bacterium]|nr:hypothetical protein [Clostridia bacterium]
MKKIIALMLILSMVVAFVACTGEKDPDDTTVADTTVADTTVADDAQDEVKVMTYAEYVAAAIDDAVVIEAYVQATQSWWEDKITVYAQDKDGAYFIYELACAEADAERLIPGQKIRVSGHKAEWSGEIEIVDATFEFVNDADTFVAEPLDVTEYLGRDDLIDHQNKLVLFKGLTVKSIEYKNGEPGDDIYVTVSKDGADYSFCVERYLTDPDTDVYKAVGELEAGDVIDVEGFLYWYEGVNTHITKVTPAEVAE